MKINGLISVYRLPHFYLAFFIELEILKADKKNSPFFTELESLKQTRKIAPNSQRKN